MKLGDINGRLALLIKEAKIKNQPSNGKSSYFILKSVSETGNTTLKLFEFHKGTYKCFKYRNYCNATKILTPNKILNISNYF